MVQLQTLAIFLATLKLVSATFDNTSFVITHYGAVRGFEYQISTGGKADIFLGVPYAKPPVGELRFERPQPPKKWFLTHPLGLATTAFTKGCAPSGLPTNDISTNSEDCLYMNIYRPSNSNPPPPPGGYPVLMWIHGGGNTLGTAQQFGYVNLTENFVPQGIIVVSIQYRLGPFGFATTGDSVMPGNLALWDCTQALKFLHKVLPQFGGNKNKIHIWGLSSSAIMLSSMQFSPHSRDLFHGSVLQSGSAFSRAISNEGIQYTTELANQLGCNTSSSVAIKACLKSKSLSEFFTALNVTGLNRIGGNANVQTSKYLARIDGDFFPHNFTELIKTASPKPWYGGIGSSEASLYSIFGKLFTPITPFVIPKTAWSTFGEANFSNFVRTVVIDEPFYGAYAANISQDIIDFYSNDKTNTSDYVYWITKYTQLISDYIFCVPLLVEARLKLNYSWPSYLYQNQHYSQYLYDQIDLNPPLRGSFHTNEYTYQFGFFNLGIVFPMGPDEIAFRKALADTIGNFVKTGNASTSYLNWAPISSTNPFGYAKLNAASSYDPTALFNDGRLAFWDSIRDGKYPFDPLLRINFANISDIACDISTNTIC